MNGRENEAFVMERLDKAYASVEWINFYPHYALQNCPISRFDHGSIIMDFDLQQPFRRSPFRFEIIWLSHIDCKKIAERAWRTHSVGFQSLQTAAENYKCEEEVHSVEQNSLWKN